MCSQLDMFIITGISERTVRNFEYKLTSANTSTIEALTNGYKLSPGEIYRLHEIDNLSFQLISLDKTIINKFSELTNDHIDFYLKELKDNVGDLDSDSFKYSYYNQHFHFLKGLVEYYKGESEVALSYYLKAIKFTINNFDLSEIYYFLEFIDVFSKLEIRIIYNIASVIYYFGKEDLSNKIIDSLVDKCDENWEFYCEILTHKSILQYRKKDYNSALSYINKAITISKKIQHYRNLSLYYYNRAAIKLELQDPSYKKDMEITFNLCNYMGQYSLEKSLRKKFEKWNVEGINKNHP